MNLLKAERSTQEYLEVSYPKDITVEEAVDIVSRGSSIMTQAVRDFLDEAVPASEVAGETAYLAEDGTTLACHIVMKTRVTPAVSEEDS